MIDTQTIIDLEKGYLDRYAKDTSGSKLALLVAKQTRKYVVQEIVKSFLKRGEKDAAYHVETFYD